MAFSFSFSFCLSTPTIPTLLFTLSLLLSFLTTPASSATFNCSATTTCQSLIDYVPQNTTTLNAIKTLFNISHLRTLLGANNLLLTTALTQNVTALQKILIPFTCLCSNGTGVSNKRPQYIVKPGDDLDHIATVVFSRLVKYQEIAAVNKIPDPSQIRIGQKLWIPLPCSCDEVNGERVVHYGHVVEAGSSVEAIATKYGTDQETLLRINGIADPKTLQANQVLDVPLKACSSSVSNNSLDAPLLVSNNTYVFTANNCVKCQCSSANNWTLQCEPSTVNSTGCPAMQCQGSSQLFLGNTTTSGCDQTTCTYAGYTNKTDILITLATQSTCAAPPPDNKNNASRMGLQGSSWSFLFAAIHLALLFLHVLQ
ncbi:PREDICTED: lysM domain-containing GPI-anchored [Prunus dulcis]|uniref:PREDICTED: lysM domain-containing GPI-anchored n=1 Tax=Prunus dulcis TaxID=3755 RepID=A0A5E4FRG1_PRUDU|nr:lysM domain-containing GPI-anchored protein 2-like [Prunus dulcis]VVA30043.1 PREDICTED: lysM domain-containing GPI-anchored [Prunus dulcis]